MTSYSHLQTNVFAKFVLHNMHIIVHALFLLVVAQYVSVMNINYQHSKLGERGKTQHSTLR